MCVVMRFLLVCGTSTAYAEVHEIHISIALNLFLVPSLKPHLGDRSEALFLLFL